MFNRVFRRKDDTLYAELSRKARVEKAQKAGSRPHTAPSSISMSSSSQITLPSQIPAADKRRSLQDGLLLNRELQKRPSFPSASPAVPPVENHATVSPASEEISRPPIERVASSASYELRNPFRSTTSESITTVSMCHTASESLAGSELPVERTLPRYFPEHTSSEVTDHRPRKASIFTLRANNRSADPFVDENSSESESTTTTAVQPSKSRTMPLSPPKRDQWSFLKSAKSPKLSKDFLQVDIPSGVMSPPMAEDGHRRFWSKA